MPWGPAPAPSPRSPSYTCAVCTGRFGIGDVYDQQGTIICKECFNAQQSASYSPAPASEPMAAYGSPTTTAGVVVCPECGEGMAADQAQDVQGRMICPNCAMQAAVAAARTPTTSSRHSHSTPRRQQQSEYGVWIIGGSVAAVVLIGVLIAAHSGNANKQVSSDSRLPAPVFHLKPAPEDTPAEPATVDWETANAPRLAELRRSAGEKQSAGDLAGASAIYGQFVALAGSAPQPSPGLRAQVAAVQLAWTGVKEQMAPVKPAPKPPAAPDPATYVATGPITAPAETPSEPAVAQSWELQHREEIEKLLKAGDAQLASGNSFKAALTYRQLFEMAGGHLQEIGDPSLRQKITAAAAARGRLLAQVRSSPEAVSLTTNVLLASGLEALHQKRWQAGMESLSDVRQLFERNVRMPQRAKDPNYLLALQGLAVAYLDTKQIPKAGRIFEKTAPLGAAINRDPTREMIINQAVTDIIQKTNAMRTAKSIKEYLEKHPGHPDEPLLNLFGTSLLTANQHTLSKAFLNQCANFYVAANKELEKTRPGQKRWGIEWLPAKQVDKNFAVQQKNRDTYQQACIIANAANNRWQQQVYLYTPRAPYFVHLTSEWNLQYAEREYRKAAQAASEAQAQLLDPPWLDVAALQPVLPPMPNGLALASAAGSPDGGPPPNLSMIVPPGASSPPDASTTPIHSGPGSSDAGPERPVAPPSPPRLDSPPVQIVVSRHALAFAVDGRRLVTDAGVLGDATDVRLEDSQGGIYSAHVVAKQNRLALLEVGASELQGRTLSYLNLAQDFTGGPVQCAAVPLESIFGPLPKLLTGKASAPPTQGNWIVDLSDNPRLPASPLLDGQGNVVGMVIASRDDAAASLPALTVRDIRDFLSAHGALPAAPCGNPDPMTVFEVSVQDK